MRNIDTVAVLRFFPLGRLWLALLFIAVCGIGVYAVMSHMIFTGFARIERKQAVRDLTRCSDAIRSEAAHLDQICGDWAVWDDTYQFMQNKNAGYLQVNVDWPTLEKISGVNVLLFCESDGSVIFAQAYERATGGEFDGKALGTDLLHRYPCLLKHTSDDQACVGVALTVHGPMFVSSRPILKSNGEGPARGTIIMGRLFNDALLAVLREQTKVPFTVSTLEKLKLRDSEKQVFKRLAGNEFAFDVRDRDVLTGLGSLSDVQGTPALLLRAELPREVTKQGSITIQLAAWFAVATIVLIVSLLFFLFTLHLFRCDRSSGQLGNAGPESSEPSEAQELVKAIFALSPCGIVIADAPDVTIRSANAVALAMRGGDPALLTGIRLPLHALRWQILRSDGQTYPPGRLPLSRAVNDGKRIRDEELIIRDEAGHDHRVVASAAPIRDARGRIKAGILIFHERTNF